MAVWNSTRGFWVIKGWLHTEHDDTSVDYNGILSLNVCIELGAWERGFHESVFYRPEVVGLTQEPGTEQLVFACDQQPSASPRERRDWASTCVSVTNATNAASSSEWSSVYGLRLYIASSGVFYRERDQTSTSIPMNCAYVASTNSQVLNVCRVMWHAASETI